MNEGSALDGRGLIIIQAIGKIEGSLLRHIRDAAKKLLGANPTDFDSAEQVRLRSRHLEDAFGLELRMGAKKIRVGTETHLRSPPIGRSPELLQLAYRLAAFEHHAVQRLLARNLHF